jgi:hypothetical protein
MQQLGFDEAGNRENGRLCPLHSYFKWFRAFTAHSFPACRPLRHRGVRHRYPETPMPTLASPNDHRLGTPDTPAIRSARAVDFVASSVRFRYGLPGCSPPCTDQTGNVQPSGTFTSRLSTDRSPSPLLDITTTATGLLCWRDFHPLEWQLERFPVCLNRDSQ